MTLSVVVDLVLACSVIGVVLWSKILSRDIEGLWKDVKANDIYHENTRTMFVYYRRDLAQSGVYCSHDCTESIPRDADGNIFMCRRCGAVSPGQIWRKVSPVEGQCLG